MHAGPEEFVEDHELCAMVAGVSVYIFIYAIRHGFEWVDGRSKVILGNGILQIREVFLDFR
jgi:hypothetical protein